VFLKQVVIPIKGNIQRVTTKQEGMDLSITNSPRNQQGAGE
jgi:hypothetical protein